MKNYHVNLKTHLGWHRDCGGELEHDYCKEKLFKKDYCIEPYILHLENKNHKQALFKLRASSHQLSIETDRHKNEHIPIENRLCKYCKLSHIDDE